jgi:hypothetical protein
VEVFVDAHIRTSGGDEVQEITDLWTWLHGERGLTGAVHAVQRPPGEGELGGVLDMLAVVLGAGGTGAVLARSLTAWLQTRRPDVVITVTTETGTVKVDASNIESGDVLPLLQQVLREDDA